MIRVGTDDENMGVGSVSAIDVMRRQARDQAVLVKPRIRPINIMPNPADIVTTFAVNRHPTMTTSLLDITYVCHLTRERGSARWSEPSHYLAENVIVIFGAGRFRGWRDLMKGNFSTIFVDPALHTLLLKRHGIQLRWKCVAVNLMACSCGQIDRGPSSESDVRVAG